MRAPAKAFEGSRSRCSLGQGLKAHAGPLGSRCSWLHVVNQFAVDPECQFAVAEFGLVIALHHYFHALPLVTRNDGWCYCRDSITPIAFIRANLHFRPIRIECPGTGRLEPSMVTMRFDARGEAIVAAWTVAGAALG